MEDGIGALIVLLPIAVVGYGFWDAYDLKKVDPQAVEMRLLPVDWGGLFFDSMHPYSDTMDDGNVFIKVTWQQPADGIVRKVRVGGEALLNGKSIGRFEKDCQRGGETRLGNNKVVVNALSTVVNNDPVCFIRLDQSLPNEKNVQGRAIDQVERERVRALVDQVKLRDTWATVRMTNRPMRFVTWIEEKAGSLKDTVMNAVTAPFART